MSTLGEGGHVGGDFYDCGVGTDPRPYIWSREFGFHALDTLGTGCGRVQSIARDGTAVGYVGTPDNCGYRRYVLWHPDGTPELLPDPPDGFVISALDGISANGRYVAVKLRTLELPIQEFAALLQDMATYRIIDLAGHALHDLAGVNSSGVLFGYVTPPGELWRDVGFIADGRGTRIIPAPEGYEKLWIKACNERGDFAGGVIDADERYVPYFATSPKELELLPMIEPGMNSFAIDVDNRRRVIVRSTVGSGTESRLWHDRIYVDPRDAMLDLPEGVENIWRIRFVNDAGQLATHGRIENHNVGLLLTPVAMPGDVTGNCHVDQNDLVHLLGDWGECGPWYCTSDLTGDGRVDVSDLLEVLAHWE